MSQRTEFRNLDSDVGDVALELQVNGERWRIAPEPEAYAAFVAALTALYVDVEAERCDAAAVGERVPVLIREHLLGAYAAQYATLGTFKKLAVLEAIYDVFVGAPVDPDPTTGRSAPTSGPAGPSTASADSAVPTPVPSPSPSPAASAASGGSGIKPPPPPMATSTSWSPSSGTVPAWRPPNGSISHSNSATSGKDG